MTVSDEAVEAAAKLMQVTWEAAFSNRPCDWDETTEAVREAYRDDARAALEAAAPIIRAEALREAAEGMRAGAATLRTDTPTARVFNAGVATAVDAIYTRAEQEVNQ